MISNIRSDYVFRVDYKNYFLLTRALVTYNKVDCIFIFLFLIDGKKTDGLTNFLQIEKISINIYNDFKMNIYNDFSNLMLYKIFYVFFEIFKVKNH